MTNNALTPMVDNFCETAPQWLKIKRLGPLNVIVEALDRHWIIFFDAHPRRIVNEPASTLIFLVCWGRGYWDKLPNVQCLPEGTQWRSGFYGRFCPARGGLTNF